MEQLNKILEEIADLIDYEHGVIESAKRERKRTDDENRLRELFRDTKRSESKIIAFKEALEVALRASGSNRTADAYLSHR